MLVTACVVPSAGTLSAASWSGLSFVNGGYSERVFTMLRVNDVSFVISHEGAVVNVDVAQDQDDLEFVWVTIKVSGGNVARICIHGTGDVFLNNEQLELRGI